MGVILTKQKHIGLLIWLFMLLFLTSCAPQAAEPEPEISQEIITTAYIAQGKQTQCATRHIELSSGQYTVERYTDKEGTEFISGRLTAEKTAEAYTIQTITLEGMEAQLRTYDSQAKQWQEELLQTGTYKKGMYFITLDTQNTQDIKQLVICTAQTYALRGNGTREYLPKYDGDMQVQETENGYIISLHTPILPAQAFADWMVMRSKQQFIDWTDEALAERWAGYNFMGDNRWCLDGYFYTTPSDYYPTGKNYYRNLPACYITTKMVRDDKIPAVFPLAMLSVMRKQWNEHGFVPTRAGSEWLRNDYGIAPGYYDTRFNTELASAELDAIEEFRIEGWMDDILNYINYFWSFAEKNHFDLTDMELWQEGEPPQWKQKWDAAAAASPQEPPEKPIAWLVQDYSHPTGGEETHASLNHHIAEISLLYRVADVLGAAEYEALADIMLRAIENSETLWIMPDGNLEYAMLTDGSMGLQDYPYLTYNDLLALQKQLVARGDGENPALARMLASKKQWMDARGITGYNE